MGKEEVGMRVGVFPANLEDDAHAYHYGYGTYEGDFNPPYDARFDDNMLGPSWEIPRILLDSGERIWGNECWWMPEEEFDLALEDARKLGKEVTLVRFIRTPQVELN